MTMGFFFYLIKFFYTVIFELIRGVTQKTNQCIHCPISLKEQLASSIDNKSMGRFISIIGIVKVTVPRLM